MSAEMARRVWADALARRQPGSAGIFDPLPPELMPEPCDDDPWRPTEGYPPSDFGPCDPIHRQGVTA